VSKRRLKALLFIVGVISLASCAVIEGTTDTLVRSGVFYYDPYNRNVYDYRDYRDLARFHGWLRDRTRVDGGPGWHGYGGYQGACYGCH